MRLYLSGPIAGVPDHGVKFERLADLVRKLGHIPIDPRTIPAECGDTCKASGQTMLGGHTWSCFLRYDLIGLLNCDGAVMMRGWENSQGARLEHSVAIAAGMPVWYEWPQNLLEIAK